MLNRYIIGSVIGVSVAAIAAVSCAVMWRKRKGADEEPIDVYFVRVWTGAFTESAKTFNGLYQGLQRIVDGKAKRPEKVLREWCARTRYRWEQQPPSELCEQLIVPLLDGGEQEAFMKWGRLLLQAAAAAGISMGNIGKLTLDEGNVNDYTEWEGETLYVGDEVEIVIPAWHQNDILLEQGCCRKEEEESV